VIGHALRGRRTLNVTRILFWCALAVAVCLLLIAVLAPLIAPQDPNDSSVLSVSQPPSAEHLLGTDSSGRDLLSRVIYGSRTALLGPLIVVVLSTLIGAALGIASAWSRGWLDAVIGRFFDFTFAFPAILLALVCVAVLSPGLGTAAFAITIAYIPWIGRLVRAAALQEVSQPYVEALRTQGMGSWRICVYHLVPNVWPFIAAQATTMFGYAMIDLAAMSYLGLGVQEPTADWGLMVSSGQASIASGHPQEALLAGMCIVIAVVTFITLGDALSSQSGVKTS
jgi:peptide/nickel transport system permease protein